VTDIRASVTVDIRDKVKACPTFLRQLAMDAQFCIVLRLWSIVPLDNVFS